MSRLMSLSGLNGHGLLRRKCLLLTQSGHRASLALHRDHYAARRRMPFGDQRPVAGIVVPILDRPLARKFDNGSPDLFRG